MGLIKLVVINFPVSNPTDSTGANFHHNYYNMTIKERMQKPTPPFFKRLRNAGIAITAASAAIFAAPVALPAIIIKVAGYLAVAATVASTVSQAVTEAESKNGYGTDEHGH